MKNRTIFLTIFILLLILPSFSAEKRTITFEDFIRIKRLSDPQISPRGDQIAFVQTEMNLDDNSSNSDIWIMPLKGGEPRQITASPKADFSPRFSPDGNRIAFISTRKGTPQIWIIKLEGGEAYPITDLPTGATGLIWSPSGDHLAFTSSVYPECPDPDCNAKKIEESDQNPVKARMYDELLFRHWNAWRDGTRSHIFVVSSEGGEAKDLTPGPFDSPPISLGSAQDYAFSPDGKELCFVRNTDPELKKGLGTNNDLFTTPVQGGEISSITSNRANDNAPHYSPDGLHIAYRAMARPGFEADKTSLILLNRQTRQKKNLTAELDRSMDEILWKSDSSGIYITYEEHGRTVLNRLTLDTNRMETLLEGHFFQSVRLSPDGNTLIFLKQTLSQPAEIFSYRIAEQKLEQLSFINTDLLESLEMNSSEEFWFSGAAGDKVHGFLVKPPFFDPDQKYPLIMLIHGGPQGAWSDNFHYRWNAQMFAAPGYVVAMINFHGSTGYGQDFTDSITGDWGGKPYEDIMSGLTALLSRNPYLDRDRLGAAGASYGGYMIDWIEGHTDRFHCLISHAGVYDLTSMYGATEELWFPEWEFEGTPWTNKKMYEELSPSSYVQNFTTPCFVIHGQLDFRVPVTQGFQLFTSLQRMDVPSKLLYFPDEGHFVTKPQNAKLWWKSVHNWLAEYLKNPSPG